MLNLEAVDNCEGISFRSSMSGMGVLRRESCLVHVIRIPQFTRRILPTVDLGSAPTKRTCAALDEATEGLAPVIREEIWRTLAKLKREGLALIVIDKNVGRLLPLADRHYVIEKGRVVWQGDSQQLQAQPEIVQQYLGV
jgi:ABC-type Na+ transport system ATPase subunit NatA